MSPIFELTSTDIISDKQEISASYGQFIDYTICLLTKQFIDYADIQQVAGCCVDDYFHVIKYIFLFYNSRLFCSRQYDCLAIFD